jgi:hypothetical protein
MTAAKCILEAGADLIEKIRDMSGSHSYWDFLPNVRIVDNA